VSESQLRWQDPKWLDQAHTWIRAQCAEQNIAVTGSIEQPHIYPWSTVLHVPTNEGTLFFKATAPETIYEIALTQTLADWYPDSMPELVATDTTRGWMLMRDGGEPLRASIRPAKDTAPWKPVIARYAELQIDLAKHVPELLALGIPNHGLATLPALFERLLTDEASLLIDQPKGLTSAELRTLHDSISRFKQICTDLAAIGIPESLNHGDFHDGNVLLKNGRITFFDWGDASVTHPFVSLRTLFVSVEISLGLDDFSFTPEMADLLDIYLSAWKKFASKETLLRAYQLSKPVASIAKALAWHQTILRLETSRRSEFEWIVPDVLKEFLHHAKILLS